MEHHENDLYRRLEVGTTGEEAVEENLIDGEGVKPLSRRNFLKLGGFVAVTVAGSTWLVACNNDSSNPPATDDPAEDGDQDTTPETRTVTNVDGTPIEIPYEVTKVAAIFGPSYERVVVVGGEDRIVCNGDFHINGWPWSNVIYKHLDEVPGIPNAHSDLNVEDLVAMGVQLVFCFPNPQQAEAINNAGMVAIPSAGTGKFRDIVESIKLYASVFNDQTALDQADAYEEYFDETLAMVKGRTANVSNRPSVYLAYTTLLRAYGKKSDMVEVIDAAGGALASIELDAGGNTEVTAEQVIQWNPDYIFVDHAGSSGNASAEDAIAESLATGEFNSIPAVQNDQVYATPTGVFFWDAGIQKILYLVYIAKIIHPELFNDIDLKAMLKEFYQKFYFYNLTDAQATRILNHEDPV